MKEAKLEPVNGIDFSAYKTHPRILELRFALLFDVIEREYTYNSAIVYFKGFCEAFSLDWTMISGLINQKNNILRMSKTDLTKFRQQVITMGMLFEESRYTVADKFLHISHSAIYRKQYKPENFISQQWIDELDETVFKAVHEHYKVMLIRFLDSLDSLQRSLGYVSISKTEV